MHCYLQKEFSRSQFQLVNAGSGTTASNCGAQRARRAPLSASTFDGYFKESWGGKQFWAQAAEELPPGKHRARITLLSERNPASSGTEFLLRGIGGTR